MNILLLCHGGLNEFSAFDLKAKQTVQYRGVFGTAMSSAVAKSLVGALLKDPTLTAQQIAMGISGYKQQDACVGPNTFKPDISLAGDDGLLCFALNMANGRWIRLGSGWKSNLKSVVGEFGNNPFYMNLLCCTVLRDADIPAAVVKPECQVKDWKMLLQESKTRAMAT